MQTQFVQEGIPLGRRLRILGIVLVVSAYFVIAPVGYAGFLLWSFIPSRDPGGRRRLFQRILHRAFRGAHFSLRKLGIYHFDPAEVEGSLPDGPCLLAANHPSLVDVSTLLATIDPVVFPVKASLYRRPWIAPLLRMAGAFEAPGPDALSVARFVAETEERLRAGERVLVFPEGTRSSSEMPDPFGRAAFEAACRVGVPVVPISIRSRPRWLTHESRFLDPPSEMVRLEIRLLEPEPAPAPGSSSRTLRDIVYDRIRAELAARADQRLTPREHPA